MGDGEVRVLRHAVLPVVFMAASTADDDSGYSTWRHLKDVGAEAAWKSAEEQRDEVLSEYSVDDISEEEYQQELETTADEAEDHDYALVPEGEYGDRIASYLQQHTDVEIERYDVPDEEKSDDAGNLDGTTNNLSYREKKEMFPNYQHPVTAVRKQQRQAKEEYDAAGPIGKVGRLWARKQEDEDAFAVPPDYRQGELSDDTAYVDMDFVTVEGRDEDDESDEAEHSGLGSTHEDEDYGGEVLDEFMSSGFNEYAKVETADGDIKYLKNGEETSQQAYAGASAHRPDEPAADGPGDDDTADIPEAEHEYGTLIDRLHDIHDHDGSALVITDKTYEDDVETALDAEGFDYTAKDAL